MRLIAFFAFVLAMAALVWYAVTHLERSAGHLRPGTVASRRAPIAALGPLGASCGAHCGTQRWAVKTLSDVDRERVDLRPVPATVESLVALPRPDIDPNRRAEPVELTTYEVIGCLGIVDIRRSTDSAVHWRMARKLENDRDIHLVIGGLIDPRVSLIAEIPSRDCSGACRSGLGSYFAAARAVVDSILQFGPVSPECNNDVPLVKVTGVGFFDHEHRQTGAAPNQIELHPVLLLSLAQNRPVAPGRGDHLQVALVTDEADAVLYILDRRTGGADVTEADWRRLTESEGYRRLARREASMGRAFTDSAFRAFVLSDTLLARRAALARALAARRRVDVREAAAKALAYLPDSTVLRARMYLEIKPRGNSFVFSGDSLGPGLFLYLDPAIGPAKFANTLAHELHHIGLGAACGDSPGSGQRVKTIEWLGALGEGLAMLAAAGGPDVHPHAVSDATERGEWDRDTALAKVTADLVLLERFYTRILDSALVGDDSIFGAAADFFGKQGAFYTVGWVMWSTIEREQGRQRVVDLTCHMEDMPAAYNAAAARRNAAGARLPLWSDVFLARLARR